MMDRDPEPMPAWGPTPIHAPTPQAAFKRYAAEGFI
jgi:hypothetical protein